ncbi:TatD family hydrolase [Chroococcus sp. FPU101]|uniref:TatD family hydrolase n=1 Tax=Chroococcus sp. FPU101 TaxID=1974212 RepID=UPI001A8F48B9|nr:TatD family hydrolase [Chroococcus sp. FPU101]GFE68943.1 hydrolase, TatD family [Chroococcus sp. FPU101]
MQFIDTHVHLNFKTFQDELVSLSERWRASGVIAIVHSCVEPKEFEEIQAIADQFPEISFAVGLHPLDAEKWTANTADQIFNLAKSDGRVVAIGEMGLDFYKADNQALQEKVFLAQLKIAQQLDKPVIIHCRDAAARMRQLLQQFLSNGGNVTGVMHCWSGTPEETQWFLDLGFYISFSGIVTFKNAISIQESAKMVPEDRILIETDCPFLAPVPKRGKRNEPAYVRYVAEFLAQLREVNIEKLAHFTTENAYRLFGLPLVTKSNPTNNSIMII